MKKRLTLTVIILLVCIVVFTAVFAVIRDKNNVSQSAGQAVSAEADTSARTDILTRNDLEEKAEGKYSLNEIYNVLLIGADNDNIEGLGKFGNADGIMLVSINRNTEQVTLTSFMRDTKVQQPNEYEKKITSVYHAGGPKLLVEAIELNFGVHIDNYVVVNYLNVVDIVDALGGLDIELTEDEINHMADKISNIEYLTEKTAGENALSADQAGMLHLNGVQAAAYLRIRPASTNYDSGRTARARLVVTEIMEKIKSMSSEAKAEFADRFILVIETDMTDAEFLAFSASASQFMDFDLYSAKIPLDGTYINSNDGNYFILPDFEINNQYLYESIYEGKH